MNVYTENVNNIFDIDSYDNVCINNLTFSNDFCTGKSKRINKYYIKKCISKNSLKNRNKLISSDAPELIDSDTFNPKLTTTQSNFGIETIPISNLKLSPTKKRFEKKSLNGSQKLLINKKSVKNYQSSKGNRNMSSLMMTQHTCSSIIRTRCMMR